MKDKRTKMDDREYSDLLIRNVEVAGNKYCFSEDVMCAINNVFNPKNPEVYCGGTSETKRTGYNVINEERTKNDYITFGTKRILKDSMVYQNGHWIVTHFNPETDREMFLANEDWARYYYEVICRAYASSPKNKGLFIYMVWDTGTGEFIKCFTNSLKLRFIRDYTHELDNLISEDDEDCNECPQTNSLNDTFIKQIPFIEAKESLTNWDYFKDIKECRILDDIYNICMHDVIHIDLWELGYYRYYFEY